MKLFDCIINKFFDKTEVKGEGLKVINGSFYFEDNVVLAATPVRIERERTVIVRRGARFASRTAERYEPEDEFPALKNVRGFNVAERSRYEGGFIRR